MRPKLKLISGFLLSTLSSIAVAGGTVNMHSFKVNNIAGKSVDLNDYKDKVALVVNTASECGFTPQYGDLQKLYDKYKDRGFVILGFPSNDFGGQEPLSNDKIREFCDLRFKIKFPLFGKITVKGASKEPLYDYLIKNSPIEPGKDVQWNFEKFLVNKDGKVVGRFKSKVEPLSAELTHAIESLL